MKPAFIFHPAFEGHETGPGHPESASRVRRVNEAVRGGPLEARLAFYRPEAATAAHVEAVHSVSYHRFIEEACLSGGMMVDSGETLVGADSYEAALLSAGAAIKAVDLVLSGEAPSAFSCARPPGHHATREKAMGFCLFNNVAIAARHAQQAHGLERVLIVDWDVHHGNGTQDIFYEDPSVLFFSIHQSPLYPGSGRAGEEGRGAGKGFTINCPIPPGSGMDSYRTAWDELLLPAARRFRPDLLIVSAGFDAHKDDPLADIELVDDDFAELTRRAMDLADELCGGRLVSVMEGGYNVDALCRCVQGHLETLCEGCPAPSADAGT